MKIEISDDKSSATIDGVEYTRKGKKVSEWLNELPDGYRELALANFKERGTTDAIFNNAYTALTHAFIFQKTKEGDNFWDKILNFLENNKNQLPPLPKPKFEVWKPSDNELCYYNDICGSVSNSRHLGRSPVYRLYQTKEQAIEAHEKAMFNYEVEMFIKEKNEGWLPDWTKTSKSKYFLVKESEKLTVDCTTFRKLTSNSKIFRSIEIGEEIIAKFDNEKLVKWWI